jgi:hypothetical protein
MLWQARQQSASYPTKNRPPRSHWPVKSSMKSMFVPRRARIRFVSPVAAPSYASSRGVGSSLISNQKVGFRRGLNFRCWRKCEVRRCLLHGRYGGKADREQAALNSISSSIAYLPYNGTSRVALKCPHETGDPFSAATFIKTPLTSGRA